MKMMVAGITATGMASKIGTAMTMFISVTLMITMIT
jgi:hypothetical protein